MSRGDSVIAGRGGAAKASCQLTARLHRKLGANFEGVQSVVRSSASRTSPIGVSWGGEVTGSCGLQIGAHILPVTI